MDDLNQLIFAKIELLKEKSGISDKDIANGIGVSKSSFSRIRNGKTHLNIETLTDIANFFNVPPYYFLLNNTQLDNTSFSTLLKEYLDKLNWTYEKLSDQTDILIFRFMEFDQGANPTPEELDKIEEVLGTHFPEISIDPREHAIKLLLEELGLSANKMNNSLRYISQNKVNK